VGVRIFDLPITAEKVLAELRKVKSKTAKVKMTIEAEKRK
jgi:hypothetical protein